MNHHHPPLLTFQHYPHKIEQNEPADPSPNLYGSPLNTAVEHHPPPQEGNHIAYIGLGANIGPRLHNLYRALALLEAWNVGHIEALSPFYETEPVGDPNQPPYINAVVQLRTSLQPQPLLALLLQIEQQCGRIRTVPGGSRTLDLDLLFLDDRIVYDRSVPMLILPHPRLHLRRFVLEPLARLAPNYMHPLLGRPISQLLQDCPDQKSVLLLTLVPTIWKA